MNSDANAAQHEYWNKVAGPRWVGLAGFVERRVEAVNDLLLARSEVAPGERVLEAGCGTGAATVPFAEAVGGRGHVVGVDISEPMLAEARKRFAESGLRNVTLLQADAQTHRFEPYSFDLITSRFGVMFFADPTRRSATYYQHCGLSAGCVLRAGRHFKKTGTGRSRMRSRCGIWDRRRRRILALPARWRSAIPIMSARFCGPPGFMRSRSTAKPQASSLPRPRKRQSTPASWGHRAGSSTKSSRMRRCARRSDGK